jgi:DnaK suppressor protein
MKENTPLAPEGYIASEDEPYMNSIMLAYFQKKLIDWKRSLLQDSSNIQNSIIEHTAREPDFTDEGMLEEIRETEYLIAKQDLNLMQQIDQAIERINSGNYGYCEETGQEIGVQRLKAWPIATLTTQNQATRDKLNF